MDGFTHVARAWSASDRLGTRALGVSRAVANALFSELLTIQEKEALGIALYNRAGQFRGTQLHPWETTWYAARLPPAPAKILVTAVGAGRELINLADAGYTLQGFEPAQTMAAEATRRLGSRATIHQGDYEDFTRAVLDGASNPLSPLHNASFDAIILGWGSLSHVLGAERRLRVLQAAAKLCPSGPLLLSFWGQNHSGAPRLGSGRLSHTARKLARRLGQQRGAHGPEPGECFIPSLGSGVTLSRHELETLAKKLKRHMIWEVGEDQYAHVTLEVPRNA